MEMDSFFIKMGQYIRHKWGYYPFILYNRYTGTIQKPFLEAVSVKTK